MFICSAMRQAEYAASVPLHRYSLTHSLSDFTVQIVAYRVSDEQASGHREVLYLSMLVAERVAGRLRAYSTVELCSG